MTKQNVLLVLVVMLFSAHNADLILKGEERVMSTVKQVLDLDTTKSTDSTAVAGNNGPTVSGIDVSHWQKNMKKYFDDNHGQWSFVICKATGGITFKDPSFDENWKILGDENMIRGAYHYFYPEDNASRQAHNYLSVVSIGKDDFAPMVDVEHVPGNSVYSSQRMADSLLVFLKVIEDSTKRTPIIYTNYTFGSKYLDDPRLSTYPLWIADVQPTAPRLVGDWKTWFIWQKGKDIVGKDTIDHDTFNGSMNDLKAFIEHY